VAKLFSKWVQNIVLVAALLASTTTAVMAEEDRYTDTIRPGYSRVMADAVFVRPLSFVGMLAGAVVFVVSSPITAATGTIGEAGMSLVAEPAMTTFARCLGCTDPGWREFPVE